MSQSHTASDALMIWLIATLIYIVAHFSLYLAATQTPPKRRIGFTLDR